jgi:hypothetical protein
MKGTSLRAFFAMDYPSEAGGSRDGWVGWVHNEFGQHIVPWHNSPAAERWYF